VLSTNQEGARLQAVVRVAGPLRSSAYPGLADGALAAMPSLASHTCDNDRGLTAADELADTELPHVLEHIALALLKRAGVRGTIRGETSWDFERDGAGVFLVVIEGADPGAARVAVQEAAEFVAWLTGGGPAPEVEGQVSRVRRARTAGRPEPRPRRRRG
jgi:hypothetical protein